MICDECGVKQAFDAAGLLDGNPAREAVLKLHRKISSSNLGIEDAVNLLDTNACQ